MDETPSWLILLVSTRLENLGNISEIEYRMHLIIVASTPPAGLWKIDKVPVYMLRTLLWYH